MSLLNYNIKLNYISKINWRGLLCTCTNSLVIIYYLFMGTRLNKMAWSSFFIYLKVADDLVLILCSFLFCLKIIVMLIKTFPLFLSKPSLPSEMIMEILCNLSIHETTILQRIETIVYQILLFINGICRSKELKKACSFFIGW